MTDIRTLRTKIKKSRPSAVVLDLSGIFTAINQEYEKEIKAEESDCVACGACVIFTETDDGINETVIATPDVPILEAVLENIGYTAEERTLEEVVFRLH